VSKRIAVVGAGLMGSGIAQVSAQAGHEVVLRDVTEEALQRGLGGIRASYDRFVGKGTLTAEEAEAALARITTTTDLEAAADADLIVEAVFEQLEVKQEVFRALDRIAKEGATPPRFRSPGSPPPPTGPRAWSAPTSSRRCR
jgi:3-hydroxybutyryl-CoA dehydrogenase